MLKFQIGGIRCKLSLLFPAVLLYLLYIDKSGLTLFGFMAAVFHECGHLTVAFILHTPPNELSVSCFGMRLLMDDIDRLCTSDAILIASGGPFFNAILATTFYILKVDPIYAQFHVVMAIFNLLPIMPLDGGQIVHLCFGKILSPKSLYILEDILFFLVWIVLFILSLYVLYQPSHNITLAIVSFYLIILRVFHIGN